MIQLCPSPSAEATEDKPSPLFPPFSLVDPSEYDFLIAQLDGVLRLLAEMLEVTPRLHADIWARINSVLDERNRLEEIAYGRIIDFRNPDGGREEQATRMDSAHG
jgi:hypothetical protein